MTFRTKHSNCIHITVLALVLVGFAHISIVTAIEGKEEVSMVGGNGGKVSRANHDRSTDVFQCRKSCKGPFQEKAIIPEDRPINNYEVDLYCYSSEMLDSRRCKKWAIECEDDFKSVYPDAAQVRAKINKIEEYCLVILRA
eukprot:Nk52_evm8s171 gene=Nk52_evmTU8s171